jgi:hypothetical protein
VSQKSASEKADVTPKLDSAVPLPAASEHRNAS